MTLRPFIKNENLKSNNYINIKLKGHKNNIQGIGATIHIYYENEVQSSAVTPTRGYMSSSQCIASFGLGKVNKIDSLVVTWNHEKSSTIIDPEINQTLIVAYKTASGRKIKSSHKSSKDKYLDLDHVHVENEYNDYKDQVLLPHKLSTNGPITCVGDINNDQLDDFYISGSKGHSGGMYIQSSDGRFTATNQKIFNQDKNYEDLGSVLFDIDLDNDLDLYVVSGGNENDVASGLNTDRIYINEGNGTYTKYKGDMSMTNIDGEVVIAHDFNKDHNLDIFIGGRCVAGKYPYPADSKILINEKGKLTFDNKMNSELNELGMVTDAIVDDFNNDSWDDIIVVGEWMSPTLLINRKTHFEKVLMGNKKELTGWWWSIAKGDFDNDGDNDLLLGNLGLNNKFHPSINKPFHIFSGDLDQNGDHDVVLANL